MACTIEQSAGRFEEMRTLGLLNASNYSAEKMVKNYLAAYRRVLDAGQSVPERQRDALQDLP